MHGRRRFVSQPSVPSGISSLDDSVPRATTSALTLPLDGDILTRRTYKLDPRLDFLHLFPLIAAHTATR